MQNKVEARHINSLVESLTFQFARIGESTTTVCEAFLPNGFSVGSGKSACVDPTNFSYADGCKYAQERAVADAHNNLWMLEGYLLKVTGSTSDKITVPATYVLDRLKVEEGELMSRLNKLTTFLQGDRPTYISSYEWALLNQQEQCMKGYHNVLNKRIQQFKDKN